MKHAKQQSGFTVVELLITLFIAAAFLVSGFQLYAIIIKDGGETRAQTRANNVAYDYLQRYKPAATYPCTAQTPFPTQPLTVSGLSSVTATVVISCPYGTLSPVSKVLVTLRYNNPQQTVSNATYAAPQGIVTNGLVLNLDAGNVKSIKGRKSIINWDSWTVGAGGTTGYSPNGDGNSRIIDTNPWGASDVIWDVSNQDATSDADGGWNGSSFNIDNTKMYRFTTWVRRKTIGNGTFYLGTSGGGASVLNRSDAAVNSNPYFSNTAWWGNVNQWYLVVGYVWPAGSGAGAAMPESGTYALDGTRIASNYDYIWQSTTTSSNHRSYLYYSTDTTTNQQWYQPRVDIIDGTEPTVTELRNNAGNTWYDSSNNNKNGTLARGVTYNNTAGGVMTFDGNTGYVSIPNTALGNSGTEWTISSWIKTTTTANGIGLGPIVSNSSGGPVCSELGVNSGKMVYWVYQNAAWAQKIGNMTINTGVWKNLTWINYNNHTMDMYINEAIDANVADSTCGNSNLIDRIGGSWAGYFAGQIGNISIYNRAISPTEIQQNFYALRGRYGI